MKDKTPHLTTKEILILIGLSYYRGYSDGLAEQFKYETLATIKWPERKVKKCHSKK